MKHLKIFDNFTEAEQSIFTKVQMEVTVKEYSWTKEQVEAIDKACDVLAAVGLNFNDVIKYYE